MFMAFLLREEPFPGWEDRPELLLGLVIGAAGFGSTVGIALGSLLRTVKPEVTVVAAARRRRDGVVVAAFYGLPTAVLLGVTAGLSQSLGKLSLDALVQREVPERIRTSAFARAETVLQLAWVVGGFIGIVMPLEPRLGLGVAAAILVAWSGWVLATARAASGRLTLATARARRRAPGAASPWASRSSGRGDGRCGSRSRCSRAAGRGPR